MGKYSIKIKNFVWRQALKYAVNPKKIVNVEGNMMKLDPKDSLLLSLRMYEKEHVKLIKSVVKPGDVVLDIGANIGYYTLILAKLVGPTGKVYAFEPDPTNFKILSDNVSRNGYKNVVLENKAVSDKEGVIDLYISELNNGDHRIYDDKQEKRKSIKVKSIKLDEYFKGKDKNISFFKMDIQGAEPFALAGMSHLLSNNVHNCTIEFSPEPLKKIGFDPQKVISFLSSKGLTLFDLNDMQPMTQEKVRKYISENYFTTLVCKKIRN